MKGTKLERDVYSVREVAKMMGKHEQTIWKRIREGTIPGGEWDGKHYWVWKQKFDAARLQDGEAISVAGLPSDQLWQELKSIDRMQAPVPTSVAARRNAIANELKNRIDREIAA